MHRGVLMACPKALWSQPNTIFHYRSWCIHVPFLKPTSGLARFTQKLWLIAVPAKVINAASLNELMSQLLGYLKTQKRGVSCGNVYVLFCCIYCHTNTHTHIHKQAPQPPTSYTLYMRYILTFVCSFWTITQLRDTWMRAHGTLEDVPGMLLIT